MHRRNTPVEDAQVEHLVVSGYVLGVVLVSQHAVLIDGVGRLIEAGQLLLCACSVDVFAYMPVSGKRTCMVRPACTFSSMV